MNGKVVVLGAGPAGLSAAWKLSENGVDVEVIEAQDHVGGLSHTLKRDGYLFDFGPHRFHTDNPAVLAEIDRLMGEMPERARKTRVYFMGSYYDYPLSAEQPALQPLALAGRSPALPTSWLPGRGTAFAPPRTTPSSPG